MFTGLVQKTGRLAALERRGSGARLTVGHTPWQEPLLPGESVAVQGACLTATVIRPDAFECDILLETLDHTALGSLAHGAVLNLERALRPADRLGGHFVTGHVDGVGTVSMLRRESCDWHIEVGCAKDLLSSMCEKGSIAFDGVSLTLVEVTAHAFGVRIIPFTWSNTALSTLHVGSQVNIETDILEKYTRAYLLQKKAPTVTMERLRDAGYVQH
ncbi:MAG: riboflavin synthase [bacterium]